MWGQQLEGSARDILADAEPGEEQKEQGNPAQGFLHALLITGPAMARDIFSQAEQAGFSADRIKRASKALGVIKEKLEFGGGWRWSLPKGAEKPAHAPIASFAPFAPFAPFEESAKERQESTQVVGYEESEESEECEGSEESVSGESCSLRVNGDADAYRRAAHGE